MSQPGPYAPPSSAVHGPTPAELAARASGQYPLASIGQRIGAALLDIFLCLPLLGLQVYLSTVSRPADVVALIALQVFFLFLAVGMVGVWGGTPGKLIMGLRVVLADRTPATWKASILRYAVFGVMGLLAAAGQVVGKLRLLIPITWRWIT
ncbi:RDD family protein [Massilia sp. H-1]|nr:RDD family protein [Massilia sp. H-1]